MDWRRISLQTLQKPTENDGNLDSGGASELQMSRYIKGFPGGSVVKNPPAMQETLDRSLGQEDPLEKAMTTQSSILAWEIPGTEEPGGLQSMGSQELDMT